MMTAKLRAKCCHCLKGFGFIQMNKVISHNTGNLFRLEKMPTKVRNNRQSVLKNRHQME